LDETGFAPSLPTTYSWSRRGQRKVIQYQAPKGRRVNVVGAYSGDEFTFHIESGKLTAELFLAFITTLVPNPGTQPVVIVLDNYSIHKAKRIQPSIKALERQGLYLFFLPPYSPELNLIEPCWRYIKHERMIVRLFESQCALHQGVEDALVQYATELNTQRLPA